MTNRADTPIEELDFGDATDAVAALGCKTLRELAAHKRYELWDALDATTDLEQRDLDHAVDDVLLVMRNLGLDFVAGGRFQSFEEMSQWVLAAAQTDGLPAEVRANHRGVPVVGVTVAGLGDLEISNLHHAEPEKPFDESGLYLECKTEEDASPLQRRARALLRRASELQAEA